MPKCLHTGTTNSAFIGLYIVCCALLTSDDSAESFHKKLNVRVTRELLIDVSVALLINSRQEFDRRINGVIDVCGQLKAD